MSKSTSRLLSIAFGLTLLAIASSFSFGHGKAKPHVVIPEAAEVSKIVFKAEKRFPGGPFELSLTKAEEMKPLLSWLKDVGWDYAKSGDARVIRFAPLGFITITRKDKADLSFSVADALIVLEDRYWPIDKDKFVQAVKQARASTK